MSIENENGNFAKPMLAEVPKVVGLIKENPEGSGLWIKYGKQRHKIYSIANIISGKNRSDMD